MGLDTPDTGIEAGAQTPSDFSTGHSPEKTAANYTDPDTQATQASTGQSSGPLVETPEQKGRKKRNASYKCRLIAELPMVREAQGPQLKCALDVASVCSGIASLSQEAFHVITLDQKNKVIDVHLVSLGTLTGTIVHPREVFRPALLDGAAAVAFVHNHPSGNPQPSRDDREITARLVECGRMLGIRILDHVIVGKDSRFSWVESGIL